MLLSEANAVVARARNAKNLPEALAILRELPLDDFGLLMLDPAAHGMERLLPPMAPEEIQVRWTGTHGVTLLRQSLPFMRTLESLHARFRRRALHGATLLDYGCGWGRLMRLALYYSNPDKLIGVDAWEASLGFCREANLPGAFFKVPPEPATLPSMPPVDLACAFSIFTHLPERTVRAALKAVLGAIQPDGLFVFTFRPVEYWDSHQKFEFSTREDLIAAHAASGFAYQPAGKADSLYGDASMSHAFVDRVLKECGWRRLAFDRNFPDPLQEIVAATRA